MRKPSSRIDLQQLYESLFVHSVDGVLLGRPDGTILRANPAACGMLGRAEDEILRIGRGGFTTDDDPLRDLLSERLDRGGATGTLQFRRADGTTFPAEISSFLVPSSSGEVFTCTTFRDVTRRRRTQEALEASEELFRVAFEEASVGKALMAIDGHPIRVNRALGEMLGYSPGELLGKTWRDVTHPEDVDVSALAFDRATNGQDGRARTLKRFLRKDGTALWADVSTAAVRAPDGSTRHFISTVVDVTTAREAAAALRESQALFRTLADEAPVGIFRTDVYGNVVYVNDAAVRIGGFGASQVQGTGWKQAIHPEDRDRVAREWYEAVAARRLYANELRFLTPEGKVTWARVSGSAIRDPAGIVSGYVGVVEDVTESRAMQARMALTARLTAIGALLAAVAHEVNNPLAGALGAGTIAIEDLERLAAGLRGGGMVDLGGAARLVDQVLDVVRRSQAQVQRVADVVSELHVFGQPRPERTPVRLGDHLQTVLASLGNMLPGGLTIHVHDEGAPTVLASPRQLDQLVTALVVHAATSPRDGRPGSVTIRLGRGSQGMALLEVRDDGVGMPPEALERAFEPFFAGFVETPASRVGLPVSHAIVAAHGGTLSASSEPGAGTTFRVELPVAEEAAS